MSNSQIIQLTVLALVIMIFIVTVLLEIGRLQIKEREHNSIFLAGKKGKKGTLLYQLYDFFHGWPVTKRYIDKLTRQYENLMPGDRVGIKKQTIKAALIIWSLDASLIIFLFALSPSIFRAIITITYIFVVNNQSLYLIFSNNSKKILIQFEKALGNIRNKYQGNKMVDLSIYQVLEESKYPIKLHLSKINDIIISENNEEEIIKYEETAPNRFLKLFLSLSVMNMKFGDKNVGEESVFLANLRHLKREINIEILNKKRERWLFIFLTWIAVIPILFLKAIEKWSISCFPTLVDYYNGAFGITTVIIIFLVTVSSYNLIERLKENLRIEVKNYVILSWLSKRKMIRSILNNITNKNYGRTLRTEELLKRSGESITVKQLLIKRVLYGLIGLLGCILLSFLIHGQERERILNNSDIGNISSMISEKQEEEITSSFLAYIGEHRNDKLTLDEVVNNFMEKGVIKSRDLATLTAQEVVERINSYQQEYYHWYEFLIALLVGTATFYIPYIKIIAMKYIRKMVMDDEIIQFQSIILMLMHMDHMSIEIILTWMEKFSNVFRKSIQNCINNLSSGDVEALEMLKKDEPYESFIKIIENLQMCDKLPINAAFDEIHGDRYNYQENRRLENEIFLESKVTLANAIAWTPMFFTLVVYMLIPWLIEAFSGLIQQFNQMQTYLN